MSMEESEDPLANAMAGLFANLSSMVKSEIQGTNNQLELLEKMNARAAEEYAGFGDVASGLRVFVEQLSSKSSGFDGYVKAIDAIERKVADFEAVVSMLNKHVTLLESKGAVRLLEFLMRKVIGKIWVKNPSFDRGRSRRPRI